MRHCHSTAHMCLYLPNLQMPRAFHTSGCHSWVGVRLGWRFPHLQPILGQFNSVCCVLLVAAKLT